MKALASPSGGVRVKVTEWLSESWRSTALDEVVFRSALMREGESPPLMDIFINTETMDALLC